MSAKYTKVDRDLDHLYPEFRRRLLATLNDVESVTGEKWQLIEGYRSQARQTWLYAQGRTRPGPIVTWKRTPTWHGTGLAADVAPRRGYAGVPHTHWEHLLRIGRKYGLDNPAWSKGDFGHLQLTDYAVRAASLRWIAANFSPSSAPPPNKEVEVFVNGVEVPDADGHFVKEGVTQVRVRPVADDLGWGLVDYDKNSVTLVKDVDEPEVEGTSITMPVKFITREGDEPRAYAHSRLVASSLGASLSFRDGKLYFEESKKK